MIEPYISVKDEITPSIKELARQYPIFYRQALKDLGRKWRKVLAAEWKAGEPAGKTLVPLADITGILKRQRQGASRQKLDVFRTARKKRVKELRAQMVAQSSRAYRFGTFTDKIKRLQNQIEVQEGHGGKLTSAVSFEVSPNGINVGLLRTLGLELWGEAYQEGKNRAFTSQERRMLHRRLRSNDIPQQYKKPTRSVIEPHQFAWNKDAEDTVRKSLMARVEAAKAKRLEQFLTPATGATI